MTGLRPPRGSPPRPRATGRNRSIDERGAAILIVLALLGVVVAAAIVTADLGALAVARARAQTAADLAALAAVTPAGGAPALDRASEIAEANGAAMSRCMCGPMEAVIGVRRRVVLAPFGVPVEVTAYARAVLPGPDPTVLPRPAPATATLAAARDGQTGAIEPSPQVTAWDNDRTRRSPQ